MNTWIESNRKKIRRDLANIIDASLQNDGYYFAMGEGIVTEQESERCYNAMLQVIMRTTGYIERITIANQHQESQSSEWIDGESLIPLEQ